MSLNLLQEELRDQPDVPVTLAATRSAPSALESGSGLEPLMLELKAALAKVLGPMAGIIFDEIRVDWAEKGEERSRLTELLDMLNLEIGDSEKVATFMRVAGPLLQK